MCELTYEAYHGRKAPLWWRMCRRSRALNNLDKRTRRFLALPVPIWIVFVLFIVFLFGVGRLSVLVGGVR